MQRSLIDNPFSSVQALQAGWADKLEKEIKKGIRFFNDPQLKRFKNNEIDNISNSPFSDFFPKGKCEYQRLYLSMQKAYSSDDLNLMKLMFLPLETISDSQFYFESQGFNISGLTDPNGIIKVYPNQPYPSTLVLDSLPEAEKTPEGLPRYFEYEHTLENLLPTVPYWISVTAFDFGSPSSGLPPLETSVTLNTANVYPLETAEGVAQKNLEVFVYPNPYRIDRNYRQRGFEGLDTLGQRLTRNQQSDNRSRRIHFANLPAKCTISIYSLDGDLVREIFHDKNILDPNASHNTWDLITRNTQAVVSGLYYWTVENTETGDVQIGKLVIIM